MERKIEANCSPEHPVNDVIAPLTTNPFEVRWLGTPRGASRRFAGDRRSDHAGEALDDVHAHNPFAARPIAGDAIPFFRDPLVRCERGPAGRGDWAEGRAEAPWRRRTLEDPTVEAPSVLAAGLSNAGTKMIIGAEAHALLSQLRSVVLS